MSAQLDLLYFVRAGPNEELRYSLRSLANLEHGQVWIVGDVPAWVRNVCHVQGNPWREKSANVYANLQIACREITAREVIILNDDFYVTAPVRQADLEPLRRGLLTEHLAHTSGSWMRSLRHTLRWLRAYGITEPWSYELHVPVRMDLRSLGALLELADDGIRPQCQWRTLYGNVYGIEAREAPDVRLRPTMRALPEPFASSDDVAFGRWCKALEARYPEPSPYESA